MSLGQVALLATAAVLLFWMLGAYNRLVGLRNGVARAWAEVDEALARRADTLLALAAALRAPLADESGALDALHHSQAALTAAAERLRERPLAAAPADELVLAQARLAAARDRVLALLDGRPEVDALAEVAPHRSALLEGQPRLDFARQRFNEAAAAYNEAARQFPTRLLARLYGFGTAGRI